MEIRRTISPRPTGAFRLNISFTDLHGSWRRSWRSPRTSRCFAITSQETTEHLHSTAHSCFSLLDISVDQMSCRRRDYCDPDITGSGTSDAAVLDYLTAIFRTSAAGTVEDPRRCEDYRSQDHLAERRTGSTAPPLTANFKYRY